MANFICIAGRHINLDQVRCVYFLPSMPRRQGEKHGVRIEWTGRDQGSLIDVTSAELNQLHQRMYPASGESSE